MQNERREHRMSKVTNEPKYVFIVNGPYEAGGLYYDDDGATHFYWVDRGSPRPLTRAEIEEFVDAEIEWEEDGLRGHFTDTVACNGDEVEATYSIRLVEREPKYTFDLFDDMGHCVFSYDDEKEPLTHAEIEEFIANTYEGSLIEWNEEYGTEGTFVAEGHTCSISLEQVWPRSIVGSGEAYPSWA